MTAQIIKTKTQYNSSIFQEDQEASAISYTSTWLKELIKWWYISIPVIYVLSLRRTLTIIDDNFSTSLLLTHFFTPWHRDNTFVGYFIGIIMKLFLIPIGAVVLLITLILYLVFILLWFLLPVVTIVFIVISPFLKPF